MRRLAVLLVISVFALASLLGTEVLAETREVGSFRVGITPYVPWEGVSFPKPVSQSSPDGGGIVAVDEKFQGYELFFEEFAAVPVIENAEFMTVIVEEGFFALDLRTQEGLERQVDMVGPESGITVHPGDGAPIEYMEATGEEASGYYQPAGTYVQDAVGDCTSMCVIPPETIVQVKAGDRVITRDRAICTWCLLNSNEVDRDDQGLLLVAPIFPLQTLANDFSWTTSWSAHQDPEGEAAATQTGWAFNPPPGCHRGPG